MKINTIGSAYNAIQRRSLKDFIFHLRSKGWRRFNGGVYKLCLHNENLVVKMPNPKYYGDDFNDAKIEIRREWEQSKIIKRYVPTIFLYDDIIMIQEKLKACKCRGWGCEEAQIIADRYGLDDWSHNHGTDKDGNIKFFDWVYRRNDYLYSGAPLPKTTRRKL